LTGTFGGSIATTKSTVWTFPFSYTITTANVWTYITVTISPPTTSSGANTDNTGGVYVRFGLGSTGTSVGTAGAWTSSGNYVQPTGTVSVVGTSGATFYITGVQFESGSYATPFERRLYNMELMMCQRYYWKFSAAASGGYQIYCILSWESTSAAWGPIPFKVSMRARPSMTVNGSLAGTPGPALGTFVLDTNQTGTEGAGVGWSNATGGTVGYSHYVRQSGNNAGYLDFSAEL
jgi:hypothetical protein